MTFTRIITVVLQKGEKYQIYKRLNAATKEC